MRKDQSDGDTLLQKGCRAGDFPDPGKEKEWGPGFFFREKPHHLDGCGFPSEDWYRVFLKNLPDAFRLLGALAKAPGQVYSVKAAQCL